MLISTATILPTSGCWTWNGRRGGRHKERPSILGSGMVSASTTYIPSKEKEHASSKSHDADLYQHKNVDSLIERRHQLNIQSLNSCGLRPVDTHDPPDVKQAGISSRLNAWYLIDTTKLRCTYGAYLYSPDQLASISDGLFPLNNTAAAYRFTSASFLALLAIFPEDGQLTSTTSRRRIDSRGLCRYFAVHLLHRSHRT